MPFLLIDFPVFDPIAISIGPIAIRWYALAYIAGFILGWRYALWLTRRTTLPPDRMALDDFLTWAVVGTILGGRLGYVLFYNLDEYLAEPLSILEIWHAASRADRRPHLPFKVAKRVLGQQSPTIGGWTDGLSMICGVPS